MFKRMGAFGAIVAGIVAFATPAFAHVTVHPDSFTAGSSDVELTFRVPNEKANASTTTVDVAFPTTHPMAGVLVKPIPGWTSTITTKHLTTPIKTDDGNITDTVSEVVWTATSAEAQIQPNQYQDFNVAVGQLPEDAATLPFKTIQTYSDGTVVRWIETGSHDDVENPAPVVKLSAAVAATGHDHASTTTDTKDSPARPLAIVGIVVGGVALIIAVFRRR